MTIKETRRLYYGASADYEMRWYIDFSPEDREFIRREMEEIVAAKSDRAGGRIIDWWGCWDRKCTATAFARRVRELHRQEVTP